jgi:hypothetical protein
LADFYKEKIRALSIEEDLYRNHLSLKYTVSYKSFFARSEEAPTFRCGRNHPTGFVLDKTV